MADKDWDGHIGEKEDGKQEDGEKKNGALRTLPVNESPES